MNNEAVAGHYGVLIFDPSGQCAVSLINSIQAAGMETAAFESMQTVLKFLDTRHVHLAVLVLHSRTWWKDELRLFCNSIRYLQQKPEPEILCILNWSPKNAEEAAMDQLSGDALRADVRHEW